MKKAIGLPEAPLTMTDHVKTLHQAREQMVDTRRKLAEELGKPYDPKKTPRMRTNFVEIQTVIEQIDKAIADEQKLVAPVKRFGDEDRYTEEPPEGF